MNLGTFYSTADTKGGVYQVAQALRPMRYGGRTTKQIVTHFKHNILQALLYTVRNQCVGGTIGGGIRLVSYCPKSSV
ncbi:MAG: hypothetical protein GY942_03350 [Aestuariibacter sp.]|nr:hypothetical protein [Aestuariibacter sp.]